MHYSIVKTKAWKQLKSLSYLWETYQPPDNCFVLFCFVFWFSFFPPLSMSILPGTLTLPLRSLAHVRTFWRILSSSLTNFINSTRRQFRFPNSQDIRIREELLKVKSLAKIENYHLDNNNKSEEPLPPNFVTLYTIQQPFPFLPAKSLKVYLNLLTYICTFNLLSYSHFCSNFRGFINKL